MVRSIRLHSRVSWTIFCHLATSSLTNAPNCSGVLDCAMSEGLDSNNSNAFNLDHVVRKSETPHLDRRTGRQTRTEVAMTNVHMLEKFFDIGHVGRRFHEIRKR